MLLPAPSALCSHQRTIEAPVSRIPYSFQIEHTGRHLTAHPDSVRQPPARQAVIVRVGLSQREAEQAVTRLEQPQPPRAKNAVHVMARVSPDGDRTRSRILGESAGKEVQPTGILEDIDNVTGYTRDMNDASSRLGEETPEWELVFRFTASRLCLAFCATVGERWRRNFERLRAPEDLSRWVRAADLLQFEPPVTAGLLGRACELREVIHRAVRAGIDERPTDDADRELLNAWVRRPGLTPQLAKDGTSTTWAGADPVSACLSTLARDTVELLTSADITRVRECAASDCSLLFLDRSRPGRRRWCADMACGTKSRSASYRRRRDATTPPQAIPRRGGSAPAAGSAAPPVAGGSAVR